MNTLGKTLISTILLSLVCILPQKSVAHNWMAPKAEAAKPNPIAMSEDSVKNGKLIFSQECAYCHGENGRGMSNKAATLETDTPDLLEGLKSHSEGDFHWKVLKGKGEMPGYEGELSDREIWDILNYLKSVIE